MNYTGEIIQVQIVSKFKDQTEEEKGMVRIKKEKKFHHIVIQSDHRLEFIFAGKYFCYRSAANDDLCIITIDPIVKTNKLHP